jgi:hypothetical protein
MEKGQFVVEILRNYVTLYEVSLRYKREEEAEYFLKQIKGLIEEEE